MAWDNLTLPDKARMMQLAVKSGITDLRTIRDVYNSYAEGGKIHIAPSKKGTFTAEATKHGKSVQAFASQVLAHKENYSPAMVKKANFARNAAKWHASGGVLENVGDENVLNSPKYNSAQEATMYRYLVNNGLSEVQAAAALGNMAVESYLNADIQQHGGGPAYGLIQAEGARQEAMKNFRDVPYLFGSTLSPEEQQQLDYVIQKGIKSYTSGEWGNKGFKGARQARQAFLDVDDINKASDIFTYNYLRPGKPQIDKRRNMAKYYYEKYKEPYKVPFNALEGKNN